MAPSTIIVNVWCYILIYQYKYYTYTLQKMWYIGTNGPACPMGIMIWTANQIIDNNLMSMRYMQYKTVVKQYSYNTVLYSYQTGIDFLQSCKYCNNYNFLHVLGSRQLELPESKRPSHTLNDFITGESSALKSRAAQPISIGYCPPLTVTIKSVNPIGGHLAYITGVPVSCNTLKHWGK